MDSKKGLLGESIQKAIHFSLKFGVHVDAFLVLVDSTNFWLPAPGMLKKEREDSIVTDDGVDKIVNYDN